MKVLVTGGAGFIGSALVRHLITVQGAAIINVDKLTYAGTLDALESVDGHPAHEFIRGDVCDADLVGDLLARHRPQAVIHLAAETFVDRSIDDPAVFVDTNVVGTFTLLECARGYWAGLDDAERGAFRFVHVSTDEVYGSLGPEGFFTEASRYDPHSPYAATKAASDHLVSAWHDTYGLPTMITNCSNNYGPFQFPEKLIPLMILKCLAGEPLPVYGAGQHVRDWLHVNDHAHALWTVMQQGRAGETYNIGGGSERTNLQIVEAVCDVVDELAPRDTSHRELITFVDDRPGNDLRYGVDSSKIEAELGWAPRTPFDTGLRDTVRWYLANERWWSQIRESRYGGERLGLGAPPT